jgi:hypothetical protein
MVDYSRKDVILVEDLGMVDGGHKGIYECNICGAHTVKFVANANKGTGRCVDCSRIKPIGNLPLRLIKDLGVLYPTENSTRKHRMCIVECPVCQEEYTTYVRDVAAGKSTMCRPCSLSISVMSYSQWEEKGKLSKNFDGYKVYVIKLTDPETLEEFYKIGKTYTTVKSRYSRESKDFPYDIDVMYEYSHESGVYVSKVERLLLNMFKHISYTPLKEFCGKYECFTTINIEQIENIIEGGIQW